MLTQILLGALAMATSTQAVAIDAAADAADVLKCGWAEMEKMYTLASTTGEGFYDEAACTTEGKLHGFRYC